MNGSVPPGREPFGSGPFSSSEIRAIQTVIDIQRTLGRMEHAVEVLEITTIAHNTKLSQLDQIQHELSNLEGSNVIYGQRLGQLEKQVYAGKILAGVLVAGGALTAFAIYLVHRLAPFFPK